MAAPYASAAIWKTLIQQPAIAFLESLLSQVQELRQSDPAFKIPVIKVHMDIFHPNQQEHATTMLGIDFSTDAETPGDGQLDYISMTVLQFSVLSLYYGLPEDADQRELIIEMLIKTNPLDEITSSLFGDGNNALHLAAFLNMESTLQLLIAYGSDPRRENGRGLSAFDILFAVKAAGLPSFQVQESNPISIRNSATPATLDASAKRAHPADGPCVATSFQPCISTPAAEHNTSNQYELVCHRDAATRSTAQFECVGNNGSLELDLDDGPQVLHLSHMDNNGLIDNTSSGDTLGDLHVYGDNGASVDGYNVSDLGVFGGNNAHLVERDAQDLDPHYHYRGNPGYQQYVREQQELEEYGMKDVQLHEDLTCFLRIHPCEPSLTASGEPLVSILKNRQAWMPEQLTTKHAQSFDAYEAYTDCLQLKRKPEVFSVDGHHNQRSHGKLVQWNSTKVVRIYQRHMNYQLETDGCDDPPVSEPYEELVDDSFVPTASPYDIVRPVTPLRPRSNSFGMNHNNSCLDLSNHTSMDRTSSPLAHCTLRPLPEIPQPSVNSAKSSIFGYRKGTPPPPSFLSKALETTTATSSLVTSHADESAKSSSSLSFSKRLSATSHLWSSKLPSSPLTMMSFTASETQIRSPNFAPFSDGTFSDSAHVLDQQESTEVVPPLVTDSSLWVPRMLRNLTSPSNSLTKTKDRTSLDLSRSNLRAPVVEDLTVQEAPFPYDLGTANHDGRPFNTIPEATFGAEDSINGSVSIHHHRSAFSASATTSTNTTSKKFSQLKLALRDRFNSSSFTSRATSPIPRCRSTPLTIPSIPMSRSLSEPSSPTQSTRVFIKGFHTLPTLELPLDRSSSNSSVSSDASAVSEDVYEREMAIVTVQQRRLSFSAVTGDQLDTIRAHIPRVTSPLTRISYSRSITRSPQLYPLMKTNSSLDYEDRVKTTKYYEHDSFLSLGPRADDVLLQENQSMNELANRRLSFTGAAQILDVTALTASPRFPVREIQEIPNRPAPPERSPSRCASLSTSFSLPLSQAQANHESLSVLPPRRVLNATSPTRNANWKKRKEVVVVPSPPSPRPVEQEQDQVMTVKELEVEDISAHELDGSAETEFLEIIEDSAVLDSEPDLVDCSTVAILPPIQQKDSRARKYQDMLTKPTEMTAQATSIYVLPELTFSTSSLAGMEYVHGVTHATCSDLFDGSQDHSKGSSLGAALINIQGIGDGLEVQKYKLRQTTVVQRYTDQSSSTFSSLSAGTTIVLQAPFSQQEQQYVSSSFWMDAAEFESRPQRSTLSTCDSPSTTQTGVLYLRLKKVCNFSLPLPGENTMISIRIDTGYEKVDTDYVPLEDIDMIFNQEFCLPVCPGLAITITLHLMQAPHLQSRHQQQLLLPLAAYSSPPRAIDSGTPHTLEGHVLDRPPSVLAYIDRPMPLLPQQQQQPHNTYSTTNVFHSIGRKSILSSLFRKRTQPSSTSSSRTLLDEDTFRPPPAAIAEGGTTSLFGTLGRRSVNALAAASATPHPWMNNNSINNSSSSSSSSFPSALQSSSPSPSSPSSSPTPATATARSPIASRLLQHSSSSSSTDSSSRSTTSTSESSMSTLPSSCDDVSDNGGRNGSGGGVIEAGGRKASGNSISTSRFAKWKRGILAVRKKHLFTQKRESRQPSAGRSNLSTSETLTMQQQQRQIETPVDQDQWQSYWKELGDQHKKDSIGFNLGRTLFSTHRSSSALDGSTNSSSPQAGSDIALSRSNNNTSPTHRSQCHYSDIEQLNLAKAMTSNSKGRGTPVPSLPQLTQAQIRATESPLEILTRHILFDDELCVARTGIVFDEIRTACMNQIVNVEFQTVNNWIDLNDYSRVGRQYGRECLPGTGMILAKDVVTCSTPCPVERDDGGIECEGSEGEEGEGEDPGRDVIVANIQTTVCYIPGPEMDSEEAIYDNDDNDDEQRPPPSEPQNLVDCHVGLKYFHWQDQVSFSGVLFYREEAMERGGKGDGGGGLGNWRQGKFCIVGSFLWQLRSPRTASRLGCGREYQQGEEDMDEEDDEDEKWRCLDLSLVHGIETSLGYFDARARYLFEAEEANEQQQHHHQQHLHQKLQEARQRRIRTKREDYYPVRNGFRLCMAEYEDEQQEEKQFEVEFYSEIKEHGQQWISALMEACRERPFRPYWLH